MFYLINWSSVNYDFVLIWLFLQISQLNVTFHEIISDYKKQPQYKPQVLGDIITFYDEIFIHFVNALLVNLGLGQKVTKAKQMPEPKSNNDGKILALWVILSESGKPLTSIPLLFRQFSSVSWIS